MKGILLLDKCEGFSSFFYIPRLRRLAQEKRVGHAGTLDPFASGLMVYLIGREYTRLAEGYLHHDKVYECHFHLGIETNSYDLTGSTACQSQLIPSNIEVENALCKLQECTLQVPPMFSAKSVDGTRLYELARLGQTIERAACTVSIEIEASHYAYPKLELRIRCSKGTYIRSLAHDLGQILGCGAHVSYLRRVASGPFAIEQTIPSQKLYEAGFDLGSHLLT